MHNSNQNRLIIRHHSKVITISKRKVSSQILALGRRPNNKILMLLLKLINSLPRPIKLKMISNSKPKQPQTQVKNKLFRLKLRKTPRIKDKALKTQVNKIR
jgi:hypothetical protein